MSYDIYLHVDSGAGNTVCAMDLNMTSNVAPMWRKAGVDLRDLRGMAAWRAVDMLSAAIDNMTEYPEDYRPLEPDSGWGSYEGCLEFLTKIRDSCRSHPRAEISVSY